jgi:predicted RNase H-like nuclease (RuvC/YqgF family)
MGIMIRRACAIMPLALLCGCTIAQLRQDVSTHERKVKIKEEQVRMEEARRDVLHNETVRLQADLGERKMTLEQLQLRLSQLQRENARTDAYTEGQIERKRQLNDQLNRYKDKLRELNVRSDMTVQEKQKRIEHLKVEIRRNLERAALELKAQ